VRKAGASLLVLLAAPACAGRIGLPAPGTQEGGSVIDLWRILFFTAAALGALVLALLVVCIVRFRTRGGGDDDLPPQRRGHVPLEVAYTVVPLAIVAVIFALSIRTDPATARPGDQGGGRPLEVDVTAFRWQWRFDYPAQAVSVTGTPERSPDLVLPTGRRILLRVHSPDVIHSFFVPGFLGKMDVVPGLDNEFEVRPTRPGRFQGYCAEFCGLDHARMTFAVRIVSPDEFGRWARQAPKS
jgi:cytochrome c oxidase subunit 2